MTNTNYSDKKTISIIAPNIKNGGGLELLEYLLFHLENKFKDINVVVYIDKSLSHIKSTENRKSIFLSNDFAKIKLFYKKINNAIYFGNIPPLRKSVNSIVYFHNPYLIMNIGSLYTESINFLIKYGLQQAYLGYFLSNVDVIACQNSRMKEAIDSRYSPTNIEVIPFYRLCHKQTEVCKNTYDFCYVSLAHPHKNHKLLFDALEILGKKDLLINVAVTIDNSNKELVSQLKYINNRYRINITNLGVISKNDVCLLYQESKCLIFPSHKETFGLPLVEATEMGLDVIAPDLEYVYEIISPSFTFNSFSVSSCADVMERYMNCDHPPKSIAKIENRVDFLINRYVRR